jgi:Domain of Unknown Function (DUF1080)
MYKKNIIPVVMITIAIVLLSFCIPNQGKDNKLTAAEQKAGWQLLFDGKTTNGWRPYKNAESDGWDIANGELHCKETAAHRADLITKEEYADFELAFDWKVGKGANSGLIYRANEAHDASYESASEYQLIDDKGYPGKLEEWQKAGADYDMHPPLKLVSKPAGEYNHSIIKARGKHVEHWLNGVKVAGYEIGTPEWFALKEKSKWAAIKGWGENSQGHICLQDHGGGIWFKNIKIRKL